MNVLATALSVVPTGMWGKHILLPACRPLSIVGSGIWDGLINHARELDANPMDTTEAQNPLEVRGGDKPREFSITVMVFRNTDGQSPMTVYQAWQLDQGKSNYFFMGLQPLDSSQYILKGTELNCGVEDFDAAGEMYRADITLTFVEDTILKIGTKKLKEEKSRKGPSKAKKKAEGADFDLKNFIKSNNL